MLLTQVQLQQIDRSALAQADFAVQICKLLWLLQQLTFLVLSHRRTAVHFGRIVRSPWQGNKLRIPARLEGEARGRQEGEEIGKARGLKLGRIALLQELLGSHPTTGEEFSGYDETQLRELEEQLQQQLRKRG